MLYGKTPTLSWYQESPFFRPVNVGSTPSGVLAINCKAFLDNQSSQAHPNRDALDFYCMNHLMAVVKSTFTVNEPLPVWAFKVAEVYKDVVERQANRMLYYMILITTRESRHLHNMPEEFWQEFLKHFNLSCQKFNKMVHSQGSQGAAERFMDSPPEAPIGLYLASLVHIFNKGKFGGGYGGKPWGCIAQCVTQAVTGATSFEVMLDTAYTLAHNNGPMFNKGMLYENYNNEIYKILDVQRSGQIPELIRMETLSQKPTADVRDALDAVLEAKPKLFDTEVDWQKVKDLGALHDYQHLINDQAKKKPAVTKSGHLIKGKLLILPGKAVNLYDRKGVTA